MAIRIVRLGTPRAHDEGLRLGTVRRPPRGVAKAQLAARDFYDVWVPEAAPSEALLKAAKQSIDDSARWKTFVRRYRAEMKRPESGRLLDSARSAVASHQPLGRVLLRERSSLSSIHSSRAPRGARSHPDLGHPGLGTY